MAISAYYSFWSISDCNLCVSSICRPSVICVVGRSHLEPTKKSQLSPQISRSHKTDHSISNIVTKTAAVQPTIAVTPQRTDFWKSMCLPDSHIAYPFRHTADLDKTLCFPEQPLDISDGKEINSSSVKLTEHVRAGSPFGMGEQNSSSQNANTKLPYRREMQFPVRHRSLMMYMHTADGASNPGRLAVQEHETTSIYKDNIPTPTPYNYKGGTSANPNREAEHNGPNASGFSDNGMYVTKFKRKKDKLPHTKSNECPICKKQLKKVSHLKVKWP